MGFVHNFQESNSLRPVACRHCKALVSALLPGLAVPPSIPPDLACGPKPQPSAGPPRPYRNTSQPVKHLELRPCPPDL